MSEAQGKLYVVATPIGNLADISERAKQTLTAVDGILAEDTRHSGKLLKHLLINTPMQAYHEHNEEERLPDVLQRLQQGENLALISDAGTPLINDPGYQLLSAVHEQGIEVVPIPGPSAFITALSASGLESACFSFQGFLPVKQSTRLKQLQALVNNQETLIFYETPHRILEALKDCIDVFGPDRMACIARELTKLHEDIKRASLQELKQSLEKKPEKVKGEFVLLIAGIKQKETTEDVEAERILKILLAEHPTKKAAELATKITGLKKNALYQMALEISDNL